MYLFIGILFACCILFFIIHFYRRKCIITKICCMNHCEKLDLLNRLAEPFGFCYLPAQDIMTSRLDAWQKDFGYRSLYDKTAPHFNMVFDCEPVYFDYKDHTWLIEFWKGQYGINIGGEIGIYYADSILTSDQYEQADFHGVSDSDFLPISMKLYFKGKQLFSIRQLHWWLTGFCMGNYCEPENLIMDISIAFPNEEMLQSFVKGLENLGYKTSELCMNCLRVSFSFSVPHTKQPRKVYRFQTQISQWGNRFLCKLYVYITKPFTCTIDRILYLYFFLPITFRRMLCFRKNHKQKFHKEYRRQP